MEPNDVLPTHMYGTADRFTRWVREVDDPMDRYERHQTAIKELQAAVRVHEGQARVELFKGAGQATANG